MRETPEDWVGSKWRVLMQLRQSLVNSGMWEDEETRGQYYDMLVVLDDGRGYSWGLALKAQKEWQKHGLEYVLQDLEKNAESRTPEVKRPADEPRWKAASDRLKQLLDTRIEDEKWLSRRRGY